MRAKENEGVEGSVPEDDRAGGLKKTSANERITAWRACGRRPYPADFDIERVSEFSRALPMAKFWA